MPDLLPAAPAKHPPTISDPSDMSYAAGDPGENNTIIWTVNGSFTSWTWLIFANGTPSQSGSSTTIIKNVTLWVGSYTPGSYNLTLVATNIDGSTYDPVIVTVFPSVPPALTSPEDMSYPSGQVGNQISWIPTDAGVGPKSYTIYRNGTIIDSGSWNSSTAITISLAGLPIGTYNFTIVVDDGLNGVSRDEVVVVVRAGTPAVDATIWVVVIAFGCVGMLVVFKAVKNIPLVPNKRKDVKI